MNINIHNGPHGRVVTICDSNLLGKTFTEGKIVLNVSERFYKGEEKTEQEILSMITDDDVLNIVGEESCNFAIKHNLVDKDNVKKIGGVPHAQVF